jgi:hypothetical protein
VVLLLLVLVAIASAVATLAVTGQLEPGGAREAIRLLMEPGKIGI